jgi:hypothetical protein
MKKTTKFLVMGVVLIMCLGIFTACNDYGYSFRFEVIGEGGDLTAKGWESSSSPIFFMGGKTSKYEIEFVAEPHEGYKIKEWTFTPYSGLLSDLIVLERKVVENNKSNSLLIDATEYNFSPGAFYITVEFERI